MNVTIASEGGMGIGDEKRQGAEGEVNGAESAGGR